MYQFFPRKDELFKGRASRVTESLKASYLWLCGWGMRATLRQKQVEGLKELELGPIGAVVQPSFFMLLYSVLRAEEGRDKALPYFREDQSAAVGCLQLYFEVVLGMYQSFDPSIREANRVILDNIFKHDMKAALHFLLKADGPTPVIILHYYLLLLRLYSDGRTVIAYAKRRREAEEGEGRTHVERSISEVN